MIVHTLILVVEGSPAFAAPRQELKELRERIDELKGKLANAEQSKTEAADALRTSERAISEANRRIHELNQQIKGIRNRLGGLRARTSRASEAAHRQRELLANVLYSRYVHRHESMVPVILSGKDSSEVSRRVSYYGYLARERYEVIGNLQEHLGELARLTRSTNDAAKDLLRMEAERTRQRATLQTERDRRRDVVAGITNEISRQRREMSTLKRNEAQLSRLVAELAKMIAEKEALRKAPLRRAAKSKTLEQRDWQGSVAKGALDPEPPVAALPEKNFQGVPFGKLRGKLISPAQGELLSRFGSPPSEAGLSANGLFIGSLGGQEVRAVAQGRVVFADWLRGFGNLIIIDHGGGFMTIYGNNEALLKQVGDSVRIGEGIAVVGNSGGNAESGLYFELRFKGKPIDPTAWLAR